jgi:glycosyltransferase involved in cell wall biosynthesis
MLLLSIGRVSSVIKASERKRLSTIKGRTIRSGPQWTLDFLDAEHHQKLYLEDERNFYFPIARLARKPYRELVHDITTGEGSFSVPFVVHNCPAPYTLAFMEAWMTGQPVVAAGPALMGFNVETPYLIENGVDGFVYGSVSQMRDAVGRLLADRDAAAEMGKAGRESAIRFFGYAPIKAAWKRFFDSL